MEKESLDFEEYRAINALELQNNLIPTIEAVNNTPMDKKTKLKVRGNNDHFIKKNNTCYNK